MRHTHLDLFGYQCTLYSNDYLKYPFKSPLKALTMGDTRQRLLSCACEIFAEKGYRAATVAEICQRAEANIAAVNYHFGSKEILYDHVLDHASVIASDLVPIDGGLPSDAPAEQRLRTFITALVSRTLSDGPEGWLQKLAAQERAKSGSTVAHKSREILREDRVILEDAIRDLVGHLMPPELLHASARYVFSLCLFYGFNETARERLLRKEGNSTDAIREIAESTARFAMGGIRACAETVRNTSQQTDHDS
jgi:TetR/AcrR family transcriptional regulator, regulator of cefoperazone and chloramphenicol sensitivity